MKHSDQKIRAILFYFSALIFLIGLPFILSFSLGYKFDTRSFKFTKTGLIAIKTQPQAATVYFDNKILNEKTPLTINELLPGEYNLKIELEKYYPWRGAVSVNKGQVTRLEKIILFPLRPNIKQLNPDRLSIAWIDEEDRVIYYMNEDEAAIYASNLEGENYKQVAAFVPINPQPVKFRISADKQKLLYFNQHQAVAVPLARGRKDLPRDEPLVLNYPDDTIVDIFWHSDSFHLILVTYKKIQVLEAKRGQEPVDLVTLNRKYSAASYDSKSDTLYFTDYQKADDANFYKNLYKIELGGKSFPFKNLINLEANE